MADVADLYLAKARASLAGAQSELAQQRFDNAVNRAYYACFQAAIYALLGAGIRQRGGSEVWDHAFVQARFVGDLINRRKLYASELRGDLPTIMYLRHRADYHQASVTSTQATRAVRRASRFVAAIQSAEGTS
jgi:uncharacterized protein (UPF0332 family)